MSKELIEIKWEAGEVHIDWDIVHPRVLEVIGIKSDRPVRFSEIRLVLTNA